MRVLLTVAVGWLSACGRLEFAPTPPLDDVAGTDSTGEMICGGLTATCGDTPTSSCCATRDVPGGMFFRSYDVSGDGMHPAMTAPAMISAFRLDTYEVTVGRFRQFVDAGQGTQLAAPAAGAGAHTTLVNSGWRVVWNGSLASSTTALRMALKCDATYETWTDAAAANESLPINCISWYEAMAYCAWDGGFLPTEAEWNYAASGGDEHRAYPWSSPPGDTTIDATRASYACLADGAPACSRDDLERVGSAPAGAGRWGHQDVGGSVWEWVLDWYAIPYETPCMDCGNLTDAAFRVHRGGAFRNTEPQARSANRGYDPPSYRASDVGVRCARLP